MAKRKREICGCVYSPAVAQQEERDDEAREQLRAMIAEHGVAIRHVFGGSGGARSDFSYTVGLTAVGHPEIVTEGLPHEVAHAFLNMIADDVHRGQRFPAGTIRTDLTDEPAPVVFLHAADISELDAVHELYGRVEAVQLVWTDSASRLPWHPGYHNPPDQQRLRGPIPAEALALPAPTADPHDTEVSPGTLVSIDDRSVVAVTPAVLGGTPASSVWHTEDDTWCFTTDDHHVPSPGLPLLGVARDHLLVLDPSLRDLDGLPAGVRATRSGGHGSDWVQWPQGSA